MFYLTFTYDQDQLLRVPQLNVITLLKRKMSHIGLSFYTCCCAMLSHVWLFATLWAVAHQAPLSLGFPRQEPWSGLPFPPPGDLSHPGIGGVPTQGTYTMLCKFQEYCKVIQVYIYKQLYIYVYIYFYIFFHADYYKVLSILSYAIQ